MVDGSVLVLTNDGRAVVGTLRGYDQATNLAIEDCHERVFSSARGVERVALGLFFVRGDNVLSLFFLLALFSLCFVVSFLQSDVRSRTSPFCRPKSRAC